MRHDVLLFDGDCNLCRAAAAKVGALAQAPRLELRSFRDPGAIDEFRGLSADQCEEAMHLVRGDGQRYAGAEALVQVVRGRWWGRLLWLYYVPGVRQAVDAAYRVIARYRFRIAGRKCGSGGCEVHFRPRKAHG